MTAAAATTPVTTTVPTAAPAEAARPRWVRPAVVLLLAGTAWLYIWNLAASGWANAFYSAAAQAGSSSWEAFFYGSSDAANSITVDKPPASLWVMALSVRLFGLSPWSILLPQALMGVATVGVLYLAVRRVTGPAPALLAGAAAALTPVAALMFRYNNPDALLVLLLTVAAYVLLRAVERAGWRALALVGVLVGLAFLTKMMQALLVVPGFALAYLVAAPTSLGRRVLHLLGAGLALVFTAGWWVAVVELVPASARPYIGGSQTNSVWELIWGYNGLGRLTGNETGSVGGGRGWGEFGLLRLFDVSIGGQVAWLLPAALILLLAGLVVAGRAPRTDPTRAALLVWAGWLLVTGLTFSLMAGIFHAYYTVALVPPIAALVATGGWLLWQRRGRLWARLALAGSVVVTVLWSVALLGRADWFLRWLPWPVLAGGLLAAGGLLLAHRAGPRLSVPLLGVAVLAGLAGPGAHAVQTAVEAHSGSIPTAGPTSFGFTGLRGGFGPGGGFGPSANAAAPPVGPALAAPAPGLPGGVGSPAVPGVPPPTPLLRTGNLLQAGEVSVAVADALGEDASAYTWVAAAIGSNRAAGYQLATELPVMPLGGFNGSDPSPTLEQFQRYVAEGRIHWFIGGGGAIRSNSGSNQAHLIAAWVETRFAPSTVDGLTMYDLTQPLR